MAISRRSFVLAGATVLLCAIFSVVLEGNRVCALLLPPKRLLHTSKTMPTAALFSARKSIPEPPQHPTRRDRNDPERQDSKGLPDSKNLHYYMNPKDQAAEVTTTKAAKNVESGTNPQPAKRALRIDFDPTVGWEEGLLSQFAAMESLLLRETSEQHDADGPFDDTSSSPTRENARSQIGKTTAASSATTTSIPYFLKPVPHFFGSSSSSTSKTDETNNKTTKKINVPGRDDDDDAKKLSNDDLAPGSSILLGKEEHVVSQTTDSSLIAEEILKRPASIDRFVYAFNTNMVDILYEVISLIYPTTSKQQSPKVHILLGTEYNEHEHKTILRFEKFYVFETVARIPYFAYLSVLHMRESLGHRGFLHETKATTTITREQQQGGGDDDAFVDEVMMSASEKQASDNLKRIETMRTHYAQADNELHHLLIMEALGGNSRAIDRFLAHTIAFSYYWFVVVVFLWNEKAAYHLNEIIENHAYNTYDEFLSLHEDELKAMPVPDIARKYYESDYRKNPHLFEAFCAVSKTNDAAAQQTTSTSNNPRGENRPHELRSLYDVFRNVRDDEKEHWMSLCNIVQYDDMGAADEAKVKSTTQGSK